MSYKNIVRPFIISLIEEFGFKYYKSKDEAIYNKTKFKFRIGVTGSEKYVDFSCKILHLDFSEVYEKLTQLPLPFADIIRIIPDHAFPNWKGEQKDEYYGRIYFDKYYMGMKENALSYEDAKKEFERLFTKFILPWFEKHNTFKGIRQTYRSGAMSGKAFEKAWHNTQFTPSSSFESGGIFQMFFIDAIISRLLGDDMRPIKEIYNEFYCEGYEKKWSEIDDETGKPYIELDRIKEHFDVLPEIMKRIDSVTELEWEVYRKKVL